MYQNNTYEALTTEIMQSVCLNPLLDRALCKKDLTQEPVHAIAIVVQEIKKVLENHYQLTSTTQYGSKIQTLDDNYWALGYQSGEVTLNEKYTRYINNNLILRTQMSSIVPKLLREYKGGKQLWLCPGMVYRRDVLDRTHVAEPHQLDIWLIDSQKYQREDLLELVSLIISVIEKHTRKKIQWRYQETYHHYTDNGIEVEIYHKGKWLEILECGEIAQSLLTRHGIENHSGLALGLGLERLVMIIKGIEDIRVLLSDNELIKKQMKDLKPYKIISNQPLIKRDLSIAVNRDKTIEEITEAISQIESVIENVEVIEIVSQTDYQHLPIVAQERLGMHEGQKNILLRIILRNLTHTLTNEVANEMYKKIYLTIHEGNKGYV